jgi:hypothetical protein
MINSTSQRSGSTLGKRLNTIGSFFFLTLVPALHFLGSFLLLCVLPERERERERVVMFFLRIYYLV